MNQFLFCIVTLLLSTSTMASIQLDAMLNKITLQLQTQQWVTTKTALVNVGVNAAVADQDIVTLQNNILQKLNQFSTKGEWHIVSFNRQLDKSGLESIQIMAQARLPQADLAKLRDKAKSISKPGETYTIDTVLFTPSDDEIKQANLQLRNDIYQQAKMEVDALNKAYPDQKYYLRQIDFISGIEPVAAPMQNTVFAAKAMAAAAPPLSVGNKIQLQATVVIAAMPGYMLQKIPLSTNMNISQKSLA